MKAVFADTFYFLALLNATDPAHPKAIKTSKAPDQPFVTTEFVLLELADALSKPPLREEMKAVYVLIENSSSFRVVAASSELLKRGLALYHGRPDKECQLTDCISFVVTEDQRITDALTGDRHFEQAGFKALLKQLVHTSRVPGAVGRWVLRGRIEKQRPFCIKSFVRSGEPTTATKTFRCDGKK